MAYIIRFFGLECKQLTKNWMIINGVFTWYESSMEVIFFSNSTIWHILYVFLG